MDTRSASEIIESNLLWHREQGGDRVALARGLLYWSLVDIISLRKLLGAEMEFRAQHPTAAMHADIIDLWLGEGQ